MFYYFGFGSNISMHSLQAKGVTPLKSTAAVLYGWVLRFNVEHCFSNEGGVGNIEYTGNPNDKVLGVLHKCEDKHLAPLDATEAYGYGYDRVTVEVETRDGTSHKVQVIGALAYIGRQSFINNDCLPSRRYLNIIIDGAVKAGLDNDYIENLRRLPIHQAKNYPLYVAPQGDYASFDVHSLANNPLYTALFGSVFDMSGARIHHEYLKDFFGGKDMTLYHLKRLDSSKNNETVDDIKQNNLSFAQMEYLNSYLNEYAVEYRYVGHFSYH